MKTSISEDYLNRIARVFSYIDENLGSKITLEQAADVACFSSYHFHRIFKYIVGEPLNSYVIRRRIESAATELLNHPERPIAEVMTQYGFETHSSFTRAFKKHYDISPTEFIKQHPYKFSKIRQLQSKIGQTYPNHEQYICNLNNLKQWLQMNINIRVETVSTKPLAYIPCLGVQSLENAFDKLIKWATPKGLFFNTSKVITIFYDSFKVTPADKVRMDACILLEEQNSFEGHISYKEINPGKCVIAYFEIGIQEFEKAWTSLFLWVNENGYEVAEHPPFEVYHNNFREHPESKCYVDLYIPVK